MKSRFRFSTETRAKIFFFFFYLVTLLKAVSLLKFDTQPIITIIKKSKEMETILFPSSFEIKLQVDIGIPTKKKKEKNPSIKKVHLC